MLQVKYLQIWFYLRWSIGHTVTVCGEIFYRFNIHSTFLRRSCVEMYVVLRYTRAYMSFKNNRMKACFVSAFVLKITCTA